jgi:hypothetical protein
MIKILREPLLHFLLLGGALFLVFQQISDETFTAKDQLEEIVVTEGRIQSLQLGFEKVWQRPPTQGELDGLVENFVREEVLYREALAMGLDRDDPIVRRRLQQKIEFLSEDLAGLEQPDDATLQTFLNANSEAYRQPSRFSFRQIYINASQRGQRAESDAIELLAKLRTQKVETVVAGDSLMLKHQFIDETERDIERTLGRQFLTALRETPVGGWQGPIVSGFGLHLVKISERFDGEIPDLDSVRDAVFRDWSSEKRKQTNELFYTTLRKRYRVIVKSEK